MIRYVITGATSFIGSELITYLLSVSDCEIYAVCRHGKGSWDNRRVTRIESEMSEYGKLHEKIEKADIFINLAWEGTGHSGRDIKDIQKENILNTIAAIRSAKEMGCRLFVESGSQAEYGTVVSEITEETPCRPFSEYGKAKLEVKEKAFKLCEEIGIKYIHLRIFSIYGENDHPWTLIISSVDKMLRNECIKLSACTQNWNFLYVKDAAVQITKLCEHAFHDDGFRHEVYNIASDDTRRLREFIERMKYLAKSDSHLDYGAIIPANMVSLRPDIAKMKSVIGYSMEHGFDDVIRTIIDTRRSQRI